MPLKSIAVLHVRTLGSCVFAYGVFNIALFLLFDTWALSEIAYSLRAYLSAVLGAILVAKSRRLAELLIVGLVDQTTSDSRAL